MTSGEGRLEAVLEGYSKFLLEKDLVPRKHQPYLVRWVRDFLQFAQTPRVRISAFGRRWVAYQPGQPVPTGSRMSASGQPLNAGSFRPALLRSLRAPRAAASAVRVNPQPLRGTKNVE
jgi:hypothetical protein